MASKLWSRRIARRFQISRFVAENLVLLGAGIAFLFPGRLPAADTADPFTSAIFPLLAAGNQTGAEQRLIAEIHANPRDAQAWFLSATLVRSRFEVRNAIQCFAHVVEIEPDSPEGLAAACAIGIDLSRDQWSAAYYYNALLVLTDANPQSIPMRWIAAVMARSLTRDNQFRFGSDEIKRIENRGVMDFQDVLEHLGSGNGPVMIHQTLANLFDDLGAYDLALPHHEIAIRMERAPWALEAVAITLNQLDRPGDALPLAKEAISTPLAGATANADYPWLLGNIYKSLGQSSGAIMSWKQAWDLNPKNTEVAMDLALEYRDLGDYPDARQWIAKLLSAEPGNRVAQVWDSHFAALTGDPAAPALIQKAGVFTSTGTVTSAGSPSPDPWFAAVEACDSVKVAGKVKSVDINQARPPWGQTALMIAASQGWDTIVDLLIKSGAKLDLTDNNGDTALQYSAQFNNPGAMRLLLTAGANPDIQDKWHQTPLIDACSRNIDCVRMLLAKNANLNITTPQGGTALHYAASSGKLAIVHLLLNHGADANARNAAGATPLMLAAGSYPHPFMTEPLLAAGADINARDKNGRTALYYAIQPVMDIGSVEALIKSHADPLIADNAGVTPILKARLMGYDEAAALMEKGAAHPDPFVFPRLGAPDPHLNAAQQKACTFVLPILFAQGDPLGHMNGANGNERKAARNELLRSFGIRNAEDLKSCLDALSHFDPTVRDDDGDLQLGVNGQKAATILKAAAVKVFTAAAPGSGDESAWVSAHIAYLADLGSAAGYLSADESYALIENASNSIAGKFSSWDQFIQSFLFGVADHTGWQAAQYRDICRRILDAHIPWPST